MVLRLISVLVIFSISIFNQQTIINAGCPGNFRGNGNITFYWKENAEDRKGQMRNWGKSEETLEDNTYSKLPLSVDPKYVYAYKVSGDCCWKIFNKPNFGGESEELRKLEFQTFGFRGIPKYPQFNVNSLRKVPCPT